MTTPNPPHTEPGCRRVGCGQCKLIRKDAAFAGAFRRAAAQPTTAPRRAGAAPCPFRSAEPVDSVECPTCSGKVSLKVYGCETHGRCTIGTPAPGVRGCCQGCPDRPRPAPPVAPAPLVAPLRIAPVGPHGLYARPDGYSFNAGMIRHRGRLLLAYRDGWAGSNVHVAELHDDYSVYRSTRLALSHPRAAGGREDPRLFVHAGKLHVGFIGVERVRRVRTSQLYARLADDLSVEAVHYPELPARQEPMEKNWSPFSHDGELLAVYETGPRHVVVRIDGDRAERIADTPVPFPWAGGVMRGGAPPVRVGDLYYHWFHGRIGSAQSPWYNVGLAVFEARYPFRTVAVSPRPMLWGDPTENAAHPKPCYAVVAFPCGAVLENGVWKVSMGWNDRGIRVGEWSHDSVNAAIGLGPPA